MQKMGIVVSTIHAAIKFQTPFGVGTVHSSYGADKSVYGVKKIIEESEESLMEILSCTDAEERVVVNPNYPEQTMVVGKQLPANFKAKLTELLCTNLDVFAWKYSDMTGVPRTLLIDAKSFRTEHKLNEYVEN